MGGNDGIIAWGSFFDPNPNGGLKLFVAGIPADISGLSGKQRPYSLLGGTSIVDSSGNKVGSLNAATMSIIFFPGSASGTMSMNMILQGQTRAFPRSASPLTDAGPSSFFSFLTFLTAARLQVSTAKDSSRNECLASRVRLQCFRY